MATPVKQLDTQRLVIGWQQFLNYWPLLWDHGEHVTCIGPTGVGKTTLTTRLLTVRTWIVGLISKPVDPAIRALVRTQGFKIIKEWPPDREVRRILLWPNLDKPEQVANQRYQFDRALRGIYNERNWTVWINEARYVADFLRLKSLMVLYWTQARSLGISLVTEAQRPAWIPLEAYSQATHLFLWRTGDERDLVRMGALNGANAGIVASVVSQLERHQFLYVNLSTGRMAISKVQ